jgi:hypothetical protein
MSFVHTRLGYASVEMTLKYQRRRDRFSVNLTKASGQWKAPSPPCPALHEAVRSKAGAGPGTL